MIFIREKAISSAELMSLTVRKMKLRCITIFIVRYFLVEDVLVL